MTARKLLFALIPLVVVAASTELYFRLAMGDSLRTADEQSPLAREDGYLQRRDRAYGDWFLEQVDGEGATWMVSNPGLVSRGFHDQRFRREPGDATRVFAFGGSTTYGIPFEGQEMGFPERLSKRLPEGSYEIINVGVAGMASESFPDLALEVLGYGAGGLIIYSGNNEYLNPVITACADPPQAQLLRVLDRSYTFRYLRAWARALRPPERLDLEAALEAQLACHRDTIQARIAGDEGAWLEVREDAYKRQVVADFERNLGDVLDLARGAGVPVWLVIPPARLSWPPALSLHSPAVPEADRQQIRALLDDANGPPREIIDRLERAVALDPGYAESQYRLGLAYERFREWGKAREHYRLALEHDYLGERPLEAIQEVPAALCAGREGVTCVDIRGVFDEASRGVPGARLFEDHCHPTFERGTDLIAQALAESM